MDSLQSFQMIALALFREYLLYEYYYSVDCFLDFLCGCFEEECNVTSQDVAIPTMQQVLQWLEKDTEQLSGELNAEFSGSDDTQLLLKKLKLLRLTGWMIFIYLFVFDISPFFLAIYFLCLCILPPIFSRKCFQNKFIVKF
jgi:hypothetical protein